MAISINFINNSNNFLGKQTNNCDQGTIISLAHCSQCGQVENKCGSRKIYFRICYYTSSTM